MYTSNFITTDGKDIAAFNRRSILTDNADTYLTNPRTLTILNKIEPQYFGADSSIGNYWKITGSMLYSRDSGGAAGTQNATLFVGGEGTEQSYLQRFDGVVWNFAGTTFLFFYYRFGMVGTSNAALSFGGDTIGGLQRFTVKWDGTYSNYFFTGILNLPKREFLSGSGTQNAALAFGGDTGAVEYNNAEKFNGSIWTATGGLNTARHSIAGSGTQNAALAAGGYTSGKSVVVEKFNGTGWLNSAPLNISRYSAGSSGTQNASLIFGGLIAGNTPIINVERFNGSSWSITTSLNVSRGQLGGTGTQNAALSSAGVLLGGGQSSATEKYLYGTFPISYSLILREGDTNNKNIQLINASDPITNFTFVKDVSLQISSYILSPIYQIEEDLDLRTLGRESLNPEGYWTFLGAGLNNAKSNLAAAGTQNASIEFGGDINGAISNITEKSNPAGVWSPTGTLNIARNVMAGSGTQNAALAAGGDTAAGPSPSALVEKFNTNTWTLANRLNFKRGYLAGCGSQNASLIFGGNTGINLLNTTEKFNGTTWIYTNTMNTARKNLGAAGTQNAALSFGGDSAFATSITEKFNGTFWHYSGNLNYKRNLVGGAGTQNAALCFGGDTSNVYYSAISERFNGAVWTGGKYLALGRVNPAGSGNSNSALCIGGYSPLSGSLSLVEKYVVLGTYGFGDTAMVGIERFQIRY